MQHYVLNIHAILYLITFIISLTCGILAFQHRRVEGGVVLGILMVLTAWWCFGGILEASATNPEMKFLWSKFEYIGGVNVPVLFLLLTLKYSYPDLILKKSWLFSLFLIPLVTILAAFTNEWHHLIWTGYLAIPSGSNQIIYQHGFWFWTGFMGYSYLMLIASTIILINSLFRYSPKFRQQIIALLISASLPWLGNILYLLQLNPFPGLDLTRIAFSFSGIIMVYAMVGLQFLDIEPRARSLILETMSDGMLVLDSSDRIVDINPAAERFLELPSRNHITGSLLNDVDLPKSKYLSEILAEGARERVYHFPPRYLEISATTLFDRKKKPSGSVIILHDITAIREKEIEIRQSEEKYRSIAESTSDVIWRIDSKGKYQYVSPSILNQRGFTVAEFMNLKQTEIFAPDSLRYVLEMLDKYSKLAEQGLISESESMILELQHKCKDGSLKTGEVHANLILDKNKKISAIHGITRDITARKIEESALKQRDILLQSANSAVLSLLQNNDLEDAINHALKTLGEAVSADRVYIYENIIDSRTGETCMNLRQKWNSEYFTTHRQDFPVAGISYSEKFQRWFDRLSKGKSIKGLVREFPDFERLSLEPIGIKSILLIPIFIEQRFWGFIGFDDCKKDHEWADAEESVLTAAAVSIGMAYVRKRSELELISAKEKAEESDRLKSAFLATMSHELRTPLNAIIGFSSIIRSDTTPEEQEEYLNIINTSGKNLLNIIEDLFNISMIEAGEIKVEMEHFSFEKFRNQLNEIIFAEIRSTNKANLAVHFTPDHSSQDLFLYTDQSKLLQVFSNILKNAVKFTLQGSIEYGFIIGNGKDVTFFVRDTGIGIPRELQMTIFDKFRQGDETFTRKYGGTGLGLSISKRLIEILHGRIWVESEPDKGSTFYFMLPCRDLSWNINRGKEGESSSTAFFHNKTILLVEDEESNYLLVKTMLKNTEACLLWAHNGKEGVEMIDSREDISVVLMDIKMPVLDGYEANKMSKIIRPNLPVIAMTAHALYGDEEKALASGFDNYIPKPITKNILFSVLEQYLS